MNKPQLLLFVLVASAMMRASPMIAAMIIVAASLSALDARAQGADPSSRQVQLKKGDRIIFFGDSLTALAIKDAHVPEGKGYVPLSAPP